MRSPAPSPRRTARRRFRPFAWLAALAEIGILVLALVGGLAAYLHPHAFWWAQLVATGLPYWTALLALATLGLALAKQRGWALGYALLLAWLLARTLPLGWVTPRPPPAPDDLVVLSFNVPTSGASREALADGTRLFFEEAAPTVAGLQEVTVIKDARGRVFQPDHLDLVTDSLGYAAPVPPRLPGESRSVVDAPLLVGDADFEVLEQQAFTLMPDDDFPSSVLRTRFRWQGREGVHYNLHLTSFGADKPWEDDAPFYSVSRGLAYLRQYRDAYRRRALHVESLRALIDRETLPVLVAGDLNATPYNWSYRQLKGDRADAFRLRGRGWGATYRADLPFVRIDFVLADPAWEVVAADVPAVFLSDHKPLLVRLRWDRGAGADAPTDAP